MAESATDPGSSSDVGSLHDSQATARYSLDWDGSNPSLFYSNTDNRMDTTEPMINDHDDGVSSWKDRNGSSDLDQNGSTDLRTNGSDYTDVDPNSSLVDVDVSSTNGSLLDTVDQRTNVAAGEPSNKSNKRKTSEESDDDNEGSDHVAGSSGGNKRVRLSPEIAGESDDGAGGSGAERRDEEAWKDAENIAEMMSAPDRMFDIYAKVLSCRNIPNRTEVILADLLDNGLDSLLENGQADNQAGSSTGAGGSNSRAERTSNGVDHSIDTDTVIDDLIEDVQHVVDVVKEQHPYITLDESEVWTMLEERVKHPNRLDEVVSLIVLGAANAASSSTSADPTSMTSSTSSDHGVTHSPMTDDVDNHMMEDIHTVLKEFPNVDANEIYLRLAGVDEREEERTDIVIRDLRLEMEHGDGMHRGGNNTPDNDEDPLVKDMQTVSRMFPDRDVNEIYAYLEAHHDRTDRVQIVTDELLRMSGDGSGSLGDAIDLTADTINGSIGDKDPKGTGRGKSTMTPELEGMFTIFPDCDPDYIVEQLSISGDAPDRYEQLTTEMLQNRTYPKLADKIAAEKLRVARERLLDTTLKNVEDFLEAFPDPATTFNDETPLVTETYREHTYVQLRNDFRQFSANYVFKILAAHNYHYTPSYHDLQKQIERVLENGTSSAKRGKGRSAAAAAASLLPTNDDFMRSRRNLMQMPDVPCEPFYRELQYVRNEKKIADHIADKKASRERRMAEARISNTLMTCTCCYDNEVLFEDMLACPEGHLFCRDCIRRSTEVAVGEGKGQFLCLADDCGVEFSVETLRKVLPAKTFSLCLRKMTDEALRQADIPDLVSCPFCSFSTIMPYAEDKVFYCLNPECLKETCRLCKEPNHIPLRCNEIEQSGQKDMRTYIEAQMSEAMIRTCWKCKKRFYKTEGCNKMTCTCGAHMCYVCREPIKDYSHFTGTGKCSQDSDMNALHIKEMEQAAAAAKKKYLQDHPEAADLTLKFDPLDHLDKKNAHRAGRGGHLAGGQQINGNLNGNNNGWAYAQPQPPQPRYERLPPFPSVPGYATYPPQPQMLWYTHQPPMPQYAPLPQYTALPQYASLPHYVPLSHQPPLLQNAPLLQYASLQQYAPLPLYESLPRYTPFPQYTPLPQYAPLPPNREAPRPPQNHSTIVTSTMVRHVHAVSISSPSSS